MDSGPDGITSLGADRWLSAHLYFEGGAHDLLLQVVPRIVESSIRDGSIDSFFFIRYADERGPHVRLRLRLPGTEPGACLERIHEAAGERYPVVLSPFEPEVERYGGLSALPQSISFFTISSAHALVFEQDFGDLPLSRRMILALCFLLWQAWGFAQDEAELRELLGYYSVGPERHPEVIPAAEESFQRSGGKLTGLILRELQRLIALDDAEEAEEAGEPVALASAASLVHAARAFSQTIAGLAPAARWSVGSSQMHMTANRLGLSNHQETYATQIFNHVVREIGAASPELWQRVRDAFSRPPSSSGQMAVARLQAQVRSHLAAYSSRIATSGSIPIARLAGR